MSWPFWLTLDKVFFPVPFFRVNPQIDIPEDSGKVNRLPACVSLGVGFISNEIFSIVLKHITPPQFDTQLILRTQSISIKKVSLNIFSYSSSLVSGIPFLTKIADFHYTLTQPYPHHMAQV